MEDDLNFSKIEDDHNFFLNGRYQMDSNYVERHFPLFFTLNRTPFIHHSLIQLLGGGPKSMAMRGEESDDKGQREEGWGAESRRMRVTERTILILVCFWQVIH